MNMMEIDQKYQSQQLKALESHLQQSLDENVKVKSQMKLIKQHQKDDKEQGSEQTDSVKQEDYKKFKEYIMKGIFITAKLTILRAVG